MELSKMTETFLHNIFKIYYGRDLTHNKFQLMVTEPFKVSQSRTLSIFPLHSIFTIFIHIDVLNEDKKDFWISRC